MNKNVLLVRGKKFKIVTLDFETYYDKDFTLRKMSVSEYIRDERFIAHGVSIKHGSKPAKWYTGVNIARALYEIDWENTVLICHNTQFDAFILTQIYGCTPAGVYLCTLSMARALLSRGTRLDLDNLAKAHGLGGKVKRDALANTKGKMVLTAEEAAKLGGYANDDVDDTYALAMIFLPHFPENEIPVLDLTIRMFVDPVLEVDISRVEAELQKEISAKEKQLLDVNVEPSTLISNDQFAALLEEEGYTVPLKISPTTGEPTPAFAKTDLEFQEMMSHGDDRLRALCEARIALKSSGGETRAIRFLEAGKDGMKLPIWLHYAKPHTTRWSGGNKMNPQNLPRGGELRRSIVAPKGYVIVVADLSQIEARDLAYNAGQEDLVEAFRQRRDIYSEFASSVYGRPIDRKRLLVDARGNYIDSEGNVVDKDDAHKPDALEGFIGKVCILGLGYSMGHYKLQLTLAQGAMGPPVNLELEQCQEIVQLYRRKYDQISGFWVRLEEVIAGMITGQEGELGPLEYGHEYVRLPSGLFLHYPRIQGEIYEDRRTGRLRVSNASYWGVKGKTKIYGGLFAENITQARARCIIAEQMVDINDRYRVVMSAHDEIVFLAPEKEAEEAMNFALTRMRQPPEWAPGIPLDAEGGYDKVYSK